MILEFNTVILDLPAEHMQMIYISLHSTFRCLVNINNIVLVTIKYTFEHI